MHADPERPRTFSRPPAEASFLCLYTACRMSHSHGHGGQCSHDHGLAPVAPVFVASADADASRRDLDAVLHPDDPLLSAQRGEQAGLRGGETFKTSFLRAEALYHHIVEDTPACPGQRRQATLPPRAEPWASTTWRST